MVPSVQPQSTDWQFLCRTSSAGITRLVETRTQRKRVARGAKPGQARPNQLQLVRQTGPNCDQEFGTKGSCFPRRRCAVRTERASRRVRLRLLKRANKNPVRREPGFSKGTPFPSCSNQPCGRTKSPARCVEARDHSYGESADGCETPPGGGLLRARVHRRGLRHCVSAAR
jgi:hypothetical protein